MKYELKQKEIQAMARLMEIGLKNGGSIEDYKTAGGALNSNFFNKLGINMNPEKQQKDLQKRVEKYAKENAALLKKHKLATRIIIDLSHLKKIPMSIKFAAWILDRKGAMPKIQFINTEN